MSVVWRRGAEMDKRIIAVILDYVIRTYNEHVLPLFNLGSKEDFQTASVFLSLIGGELKKIKDANAIPEMYKEIIRLQVACQSFKDDSPVDHFKGIADPVFSRLKEYVEIIR